MIRSGRVRWAALVAAVCAAGVSAPVSAGAAPALAAGFSGPAVRTATGATPDAAGQVVQSTSRNWAGYAVDSIDGVTKFHHVSASWTQRPVTCTEPDAWYVTWVGFDGWTNGTVEQGGSSAQCINGVPQYQLWWEMFPTNAIQTVATINAGDSIGASVDYDTSTGKYTIKVTDTTNGASFTTTQSCAANLTCNRNSAEWIVEDVGRFGTNGFFPLPNYDRQIVGGAPIAQDDLGNRGRYNAFTAWREYHIEEQDSTTLYAHTELSRTAQTFVVDWMHE